MQDLVTLAASKARIAAHREMRVAQPGQKAQRRRDFERATTAALRAEMDGRAEHDAVKGR